ncbi:hypothetical protein [Salinibacter ruber]|uniref:hypothetical protein n=1 Tax=Salinibacter ruber TaxID=146919 RepID=UPI0020747EC2|nr:hypothetical protein [Salinibacter ruber]
MSDQAKHYKEFAFGADAPDWGPAFWQDYEGFVNPFDTFAEAWDQFREMGYTDLQALHDRLKERANSARSKRNEVSAKLTSGEDETQYVEEIEHPEIRFLSNASTYFWQRAKAAGALARYIEEKGVPAKWEELAGDTQQRIKLNQLHQKTIKCAKIARDHIDSAPNISSLRDTVGDQIQWSGSTVNKWLCERNPLYEANRQRDHDETFAESPRLLTMKTPRHPGRA